jgi:hypothetical protein
MNVRSLVAAITSLSCLGCAAILGDRDAEAEARRELELAHVLEQAAELQKAAHEYSIVAHDFPQTSAYPTAARKAAYLYMNPLNPARNDSIARYWLSAYLQLSLSAQDKENAQVMLGLLGRFISQGELLTKQTASLDSLSQLTKRQAGALTTLQKRVSDMTEELQQTNTELQKLKEVDVRVSKDRRRK